MGLAARTIEEARKKGRSPWRQAGRRFLRKKAAMSALAIILIVYLAGLFAPWVAPYDHTEQNLDAANVGPSLKHPSGTDRLGRDILSRIIWGARTAAIVSLAAVGTGSVLFGVVLGCLAGYLGRWVDSVIMRLGDIFLAFPSLLLVILIAATVKPRVAGLISKLEESAGIEGLVASGVVDYFVIFGALSIVAWVGMARLVRGQILSLRERQYVEAAEVAGASTWRILSVHLLPNVLSPVLVAVSMAMASAVTSEVVLSWLGVGIQPPNPSWGTMIWENAGMLRAHPHLLLVPSVVVGIVIFSFNILGDGLNDALNPRLH